MSIEHERGSGNVFADLGLPNSDELLAKAKIIGQMSDMIEARHLTQTQAAETLGIDQPSLSRLLRGRTSGFSMDRLIRQVRRPQCKPGAPAAQQFIRTGRSGGTLRRAHRIIVIGIYITCRDRRAEEGGRHRHQE